MPRGGGRGGGGRKSPTTRASGGSSRASVQRGPNRGGGSSPTPTHVNVSRNRYGPRRGPTMQRETGSIRGGVAGGRPSSARKAGKGRSATKR
jgi:hypothetical protein